MRKISKRNQRRNEKKPAARYLPGTCGFPTQAGGLCGWRADECPWPFHRDRSGMSRLELRGWERR